MLKKNHSDSPAMSNEWGNMSTETKSDIVFVKPGSLVALFSVPKNLHQKKQHKQQEVYLC